MQKLITASTVGLVLALGAGGAMAAPPDWSKVQGKKITVLYPGVSPMEWILKGTEHGGARGLKKGESCASCHDEEADDMGKKMATGQKIEPKPIKGKAGSIPVTVQAAHDGANLYLRFTWKQPAGGGEKMDKDNAVKLAFMLEDNKIERANLSGCWETCHGDSRTMPDAKDDKKTKYVKGGDVKAGKFYDLMQFRSGEKAVDGHIIDKRVMEGGKSLVKAEGKKEGNKWVVTFERDLAGKGPGDHTIAAGKMYNFGVAIHEDHSAGRLHYLSFNYQFELDNKSKEKYQLNVAKQ